MMIHMFVFSLSEGEDVTFSTAVIRKKQGNHKLLSSYIDYKGGEGVFRIQVLFCYQYFPSVGCSSHVLYLLTVTLLYANELIFIDFQP